MLGDGAGQHTGCFLRIVAVEQVPCGSAGRPDVQVVHRSHVGRGEQLRGQVTERRSPPQAQGIDKMVVRVLGVVLGFAQGVREEPLVELAALEGEPVPALGAQQALSAE